MAIHDYDPTDLLRKHEKLLENISSFKDCTVDVALHYRLYSPDKDVIDKLESALQNYIDQEFHLKTICRVINEMTTLSNRGEDSPDSNTWESWVRTTYAAAIAEYSTKSNAEKYFRDEKYIELREELYKSDNPGKIMPPLIIPNEDGDDEDLLITGTQITDECPITRARFVDPVSSKICHHTYERNGITVLMGGERIECPVVGCVHYVHPEDLIENGKMKRRLERLMRAEDLNGGNRNRRAVQGRGFVVIDAMAELEGN